MKISLRLGLAVLLLAGLIALFASVRWSAQRDPEPATEVVDAARYRPPGEPGQPHIEITPDHQLDRVRHKDPSGVSPLEMVSTPEGMVRVQRTFNDAGKLLKEEATLNGQPVPVPRR